MKELDKRTSMITIRIIEKVTNELRWTETHSTQEQANEELQHMKENHFNPEYFNFEISERESY